MAQNSNASAKARRRGPGRPFARGVSGNPGGRPKKDLDLRELARGFGKPALEALAQLAGLIDGQPAAENEAVRVACLKEILDRGLGKAVTALAGDDHAPLVVDFRWADDSPIMPPGSMQSIAAAAAIVGGEVVDDDDPVEVVWADTDNGTY